MYKMTRQLGSALLHVLLFSTDVSLIIACTWLTVAAPRRVASMRDNDGIIACLSMTVHRVDSSMRGMLDILEHLEIVTVVTTSRYLHEDKSR